jgi:benzil reductase ((S)-benzoin forming)
VLGISRKQDPHLAQVAEAAKAAGAELTQWEQDLSDPVAASARVSAWLKSLDGSASTA